MPYSRCLILVLVAILIQTQICPIACADGATPQREVHVRREMEAFGVGTPVRLKLVGGKKLAGTLSAFDSENFVLSTTGTRPPQRIAYSLVAEMQIVKAAYPELESRFEGVKRAIGALGADRRVKITLASGTSVQGTLQRAREDGFGLIPERKREVTTIAYVDVLQLSTQSSSQRGLPKIAKWGIAIAAFYGLLYAGSKTPGGLP